MENQVPQNTAPELPYFYTEVDKLLALVDEMLDESNDPQPLDFN